ncbi:TetR/AcrR family transcriptional regulator [uncultured Roseovarius sp.]|uniref:TetR/AcrR family transcriptional regulator n=1 Tax=uncultured Roseovarius sp. TaxID=293344 RepID=UPI00262B5176|nr:TetR/AcrR family transcriptional regulator [uncultured Roseovarius sp.]
MSAKKRAPKSGSVSAEDWIAASRKMLIARGISSVKVEPLARQLGVTPGSFYWHFKNREALYRALLKDWLASNVHPFIEALDEAADDPQAQYLALANVWVLSPQFDASLDVAVREWGKTSKLAARTMRFIDHKRISLYQWVIEGFGHDTMSALVRARTMYYHQIGYYTMRVEEDPEMRLLQIPYYAEVVAGDSWLKKLKTADEIKDALVNFPRRESLSDRMARRRVSGPG